MTTIEVRDHENGQLIFDLADLLDAIGPSARSATWRCKDVEAIGDGSEELHAASDRGDRLSGKQLAAIAERLTQVIDGVFTAHRGQSDIPWVRITAIDSTAFEISSNDNAVLDSIRLNFFDVREHDGER